MALYTPQVLGAGHGALGLDFYWPLTATELTILIVLKLAREPRFARVRLSRRDCSSPRCSSARSLGKLYSIGVDAVAPGMDLETIACVLVGMGALSAAIVGGPLTMTFLVLESTGNLGIAGGVARRLDRDHPRGARDLRLFVHHLAPAPARRDDPRRPGRRLAARSDGRAHDDPVASGRSGRRDRSRIPRGPSAGQRQCRGRGRRGGALPRADPRSRGACARDLETATTAVRSAPSRACRRPSSIPTTTSARRSTSSAQPRPTRSPSPRARPGRCWARSAKPIAARRYAQETNRAMKGVLGGG